MGGIISAFTGPSKAQKREKRATRAAAAEAENKLKKKKKEEGLLAQARGKSRQRAGARGRRVFTSFLGLGDDDLGNV